METVKLIYRIGVDCLGFPLYHTHDLEVEKESESLIEYPEIKNKRRPVDIIKHRKFKAETKNKNT